MILTREEFVCKFNSLKAGLGDPDSPLWAGEQHFCQTSSPHKKPNWFVCVKPIGASEHKPEYWDWCNTTLSGQVLCYSSSPEDQQEWWGFTCQEDIVPWMLKWM